MSTSEELFRRLHTEEPSAELRDSIADLIAETLAELRANLGPWEKVHLAEAIAFVHLNVGQGPDPRRAWLALALASAVKATAPAEERDESYAPISAAIQALRYEDLAAALRQLGAQVPR